MTHYTMIIVNVTTAVGYPTAMGLCRQRGRPAPSASDDEKVSDLIMQRADDDRAPSPNLDVLTLPNGGRA